jgi:hypothetical protein
VNPAPLSIFVLGWYRTVLIDTIVQEDGGIELPPRSDPLL